MTEVLERSGAIVIGTAGHVDHGKSTLVRALTWIDPDRLAEEKARSMTIDLGFAWLDLPDGGRAGIVDVPGHERFIKNMLAGIGGIDLALLVVAADEGPMPQTREHLAIIDLLGIDRGVVALTRTDLAGEELAGFVAEEVEELIASTTLAGSPIVPVSGVTGAGLPELRAALAEVASTVGTSKRSGPPRLPVDRVFTAPGFGAVVTGTMLGGELRSGDQVVLMPAERPARVRSIQSHNRQLDRAGAGMRAAFNLAGISAADVQRGDVVTTPGSLTATMRIDVHLHLLETAPASLEQNDRVALFIGAAQTEAQISLLESETIEPGQWALVQLRLSHPLAVLQRDRFIVRRASPAETIGGGVVLDPNPRRHKRFDGAVLTRLHGVLRGGPEDLVLIALGNGVKERASLVDEIATTFGQEAAEAAIDNLIQRGVLDRLTTNQSDRADLIISRSELEAVIAKLKATVDSHHRSFPLRPGLPREEARRELGMPAQAFEAVVNYAEQSGVLGSHGAVLRLPGFEIQLQGRDQAMADAFVAALEAAPFVPPSPGEFGVGPELLSALDNLGLVVRVSDTMAFAPVAYQELIHMTNAYLDAHGEISMAEFRDLVGTTRKYAQPLLEDFDRRNITRRVGDVRRKYGRDAGVDRKAGQ